MKPSLTIGIDPDSAAHGVAFFNEQGLFELKNLTLMELMERLANLKQTHDITVHIENVDANKGCWNNVRGSKAAFGKAASDMGKCRQAYIELTRMFDHLGVPYVNHKISKSWKKGNDKKLFELATGWTGRSNEDTRSAAYFGYLGWKK